MSLLRSFALVLLLPGAAMAQDRAQTLADIRAELAGLSAEFNALKQELVTTGAAQSGAAGGDALQRLDSIEAALVRLTAKTEGVELRLNKVVTDGTNRLGDLEFRLVELEGGDVGAIPATPTLGGDAGGAAAPVDPVAPPAAGAELAVGEQADFDRARAVLDSGDFRTAANQFATFATTYTGGPLTYEAHFLRGEALGKLGETADAARAYLDAFSGAPDGPRAAASLLKLGQALGTLGQGPEACVTLAEVGTRFPGSTEASDAQSAMQGLGCQ
ncbi:tol-pal system protein YbgF [Rhodobacter ferrooxidans]|uniref:Cell division coordinator CpoB n=1 Tax=Rhodobacter ferrooxidans TaxID=371731 RepID=C8S3I8_9RHOB|nr:tol-pal system protein YbgF [Rhodobacter sp. SW2]EEW24436.1 tol-pal system protein YbgF [Rhodobacter sp. SW2]